MSNCLHEGPGTKRGMPSVGVFLRDLAAFKNNKYRLGLRCPTTTIVDRKFLLTTQVKRKRYYGVSTVLRSIVRLSYVTNMAELCEDEK